MQIFITRGGEKSGPFTLDRVREQLDKGDLMPDDLAYQEGMEEWVPLAELMDSLTKTDSASPVKSTKRKVFIGVGALLGIFVFLIILANVLDMIDRAKQMERVVWHHLNTEREVYGDAAPPTIGPNGTVFVSSDKLYALNGKTGEIIWELEGGYFGCSPALSTDGTLYFCREGNKLFAADSKTGELKWDKTLKIAISSPTIAPDGTVYIGVGGVFLTALNGTNGDHKWTFQMGNSHWREIPYLTQYSSPAIGKDGTIYIGSTDKRIYAINADDGTEKWVFPTRNIVIATPVIGKDGSVIVGSNDNHIYSLNAETGEENWSFDTGGDVNWAAAIGEDGTVFVGQQRRKFLALDGATGRKNWEYQMETDHWPGSTSPRWSPPVIGGDGTVYVGTGHRGYEVYALDGKTGAKKWEFHAHNWKPSFPALGNNGMLYVGDGKGIYALETDGKNPKSSPWPMFGQNPQHTARPPAK